MYQAKKFFCSLALVLFGLASCQEETPVKAPTAEYHKKTVTVEEAQLVEYHPTVYASGKLTSLDATKLSFKRGGRVDRIFVQAGQAVRQGQTLARVQTQELELFSKQADLDIDRTNLSIRQLKLQLEKARRDFNNTKGLYRDSVATLEQLQNAETQVKMIQNQMLTAEKTKNLSQQKKASANINMADTRIIAPADGTIIQKYAEPNEMVGGGAPVFLFTAREKTKMLQVHVTDEEVVDIQIGDPAKVYFDAYPGEVFEAQVSEIAHMGDPMFSTFEIKIQLSSTPHKLLIGFIGRAEIHTSQSLSLISVPVDALVEADGKTGNLFTLQGDKVSMQKVDIFKIEQDRLLISGGLQPRAQVVVQGQGFVQPDEKVLVSN